MINIWIKVESYNGKINEIHEVTDIYVSEMPKDASCCFCL